MMKLLSCIGSFLLFLFAACSNNENTPTNILTVTNALPQQTFASVPAGNYSGITWLGGDRYAIVNDKSVTDGFYLLHLVMNNTTGEIKSASMGELTSNGKVNRDGEGIVYVPSSNTLFISGEGDKSILEYNMDGSLTGKTLHLPNIYKEASDNAGLESLAYQPKTHLFWTTTESTITSDGTPSTSANHMRNKLRIQSLDEAGEPVNQYAYLMDAPTAQGSSINYAMGVSEMTALDDGRLIVLEREFFVPAGYLGAYVNCKLYVVNPTEGTSISCNEPLTDSSPYLRKYKLYEFQTTLSDNNIANYEGMCLGPVLENGDKTLLLVSDSQNQYNGILKDWFKVILFK